MGIEGIDRRSLQENSGIVETVCPDPVPLGAPQDDALSSESGELVAVNRRVALLKDIQTVPIVSEEVLGDRNGLGVHVDGKPVGHETVSNDARRIRALQEHREGVIRHRIAADDAVRRCAQVHPGSPLSQEHVVREHGRRSRFEENLDGSGGEVAVAPDRVAG